MERTLPAQRGILLYLNVKDDLHSNDVVILADSDMNFTTFDCSLFFEKWSKYKPLISSPTTIGKDNEFSHYLWKNAGISRDMMKTYWVEQNFAVFDAAFEVLHEYPTSIQHLEIAEAHQHSLGIRTGLGVEQQANGTVPVWDAQSLMSVEDMNTKTMGQKNRRFTAADLTLSTERDCVDNGVGSLNVVHFTSGFIKPRLSML